MSRLKSFTALIVLLAFSLAIVRSSRAPAETGGGTGAKPAIASAFEPFKDRVKVRWDDRWLYVESNGMPAHDMMVGITAWQQQVPLPKDYTGANAWQIPLHPVPSKTPASIKGRFMRGAIAVAANGIPIFNPQNNRGEVSAEIGELDQWGGHCGRGDDYHYHAAPIFLEKTVGKGKPIAFALDGYPIYGASGPDGVPIDEKSLDAFHGKTDAKGNYAYYASTKYPYVNGGFHGEVTEVGGQVDPQPNGRGVRAATGPLRGARITGFTRSKDENTFSLKYEVNGQTSSVNYVIAEGSVNFDFVDSTGRAKTESYSLRAGGGGSNDGSGRQDGGDRPARQDRSDMPPASGNPAAAALFKPFTDNNDATITDNYTGLMWQKIDNGESTWEKAVANAVTLRLAGHDDWRLPTLVELFTLTNHNTTPAIDQSFFPSNANQPAEYWWTADARGTDRAWVVNRGGGTGAKPKAETISAGGKMSYNARYVRGPKRTLAPTYINNKDGTIADADTGLMWTQLPSAALDWESAVTYSSTLNLGDYNDWRLPDVKELATLIDYSIFNSPHWTSGPCIDRAAFPEADATFYWSSTKLHNPAGNEAWYIGFDSGSARYQPLTAKSSFFAVRTAKPLATLVVGPSSTYHPEDALGSQPTAGRGGQRGGAQAGTVEARQGGTTGGDIRLIPRSAEDSMNITSSQRQQIDALENDLRSELQKILTSEQMKTLEELRPPRR